MNHVMLDIESMSTNPGNALVLSIGAVRFGFTNDGPVISKRWCAVLDPRQQLALGREVSKDTMTWWQTQTDAARSAWLHGEVKKLTDAMGELWAFVNTPEPAVTVWAHGITFDLANVQSLFQAVKLSTPWKYDAARDCRTIVRTCPVIEERAMKPQKEAGLVAHDPVSDCVSQVHYLWQHLRELS
ncbi:3'-5' exonuclease [Bradyrhizobium sp. 153]|uniref:3'-5' exonuclease n=1 Tax=Bradyrhizobium sp. 153 TaxID=2782627 RepID=UPI001FF9B8A1|nr:3'-5' exonuclease [Bradyrhizobium sp. 153]MCK1668641.1 3'-5' exoribonuclease [Bradyrhizobium sp. 153]